MMKKTKEEILRNIFKKEQELDLYSFKVLEAPVWYLLRFTVRVSKLNKEIGYVNRTSKIKLRLGRMFYSYIKSFIQFLGIILGTKNKPYLILAFPRLVNYKGKYIDKFTDPLILQTNLKNKTLVLQRNLSGEQFVPRYKDVDAVYKTSDFIDYSSKILALILFPIIFVYYFKKIDRLYRRASSYFDLSNKFKLLISFKIGEFLIHYFFAKKILKKLKTKKIFLVNRMIFLPFIVAAKKEKITVFELQHGITHSETELYIGTYEKKIDPDFFLTFGEKWKGEQFSIPLSKQVNIGWAYNSWLLNANKSQIKSKYVLIVSSPAITDNILKTTIALAKKYKEYYFNIRLHPQEELSLKQEDLLEDYNNISLDNKTKDSLNSILESEYIIGENSSVLYEALSLDKPVGKIMFNGLHSKAKLDDQFEGITYLLNVNGFNELIKSKNKKRQTSGIYDIFEVEKFNNLLE